MSIEAAAQATLDAQLQSGGNQVSGSGSFSITAGGNTTSYNFNFAQGESVNNFITSLGDQMDTVLTNLKTSEPNTQIQSVTVTLNVSN